MVVVVVWGRVVEGRGLSGEGGRAGGVVVWGG